MTLTKDERKDVVDIFHEIEVLARAGSLTVRLKSFPLPDVIMLAKSIQEKASLAVQRLVRDTVD